MSSSARSSKGKGKERELDTASILAPTMDQLIAAGFIADPLDASRLPPREAATLERCLNTMLTRLNSSQQDLARLMDRHRSMASDFDRLEQSQSRNRQTLETSEYEKEQAKARAVAAAKELSIEQARHALAKDEIQKARLALASVKTMAQHESKRRENEIAFVMSRWQKVSSASSSLQNAATIVLNPQEKIGRDEKLASSRDGGRDSPSAVTLLEQSLTQADEGKHTLQEENVHLREVLGDVMTEIRATLSSINIDVPHLQDDLDNPFIQITSPHLVLSPNEMLDYLSKLLLTLRDATLAAVQSSHDAANTALAGANEQASQRITELEASLAAMQAQLDAAQLEAQQANQVCQKLEDDKEEVVKKAEEKAKMDKEEAKKARAELERMKREHDQMFAKYEQDRLAWQQDRVNLHALQSEVNSLKRSAPDNSLVTEPSVKRKRAEADKEVDDSACSLDEIRPVKKEARHVRQSSTTAALKHILASSADTPPTRPAPLTSKASNAQRTSRTRENMKDDSAKETQKTAAAGAVAVADKTGPSSAALAAKDRIHRAVEAAKARSGAGPRLENITQRRR